MSSLDSLLPPESPVPQRSHTEDLIERARRVAEEALATRAEETDRAEDVPRGNVRA
jgi:hypothetical protein